MRPTPPRERRRRSDNAASARRVVNGLTSQSEARAPAPDSLAYHQELQKRAIVKRRGPQPDAQAPIGKRYQAALAQQANARAPRVLGSAPQPHTDTLTPGDTLTKQRGRNPGIEAAATGYGAARANKKFQVGLTPDGRIVHLYGRDVPASQRRQVMNAAQSKVSKRKLGL